MDCSTSLGSGKYYSVLVTFSSVQHTQVADVSLTWSDVYEFVESKLHLYEHEEAFIIKQFLGFLKENGMGKSEPISPQAMLGYWPAMSLESQLNDLFLMLENHDWTENCPGISTLSEATFHPTYHKSRWGRCGIDFFQSWKPGIFAGVLLDVTDHQLAPLDEKKGPDLVIFLESEFSRKDDTKRNVYEQVIHSSAYKNGMAYLKADSGSFEFMEGIKKSPWRIAVLRKPLFDILLNAYTKEEQMKAIRDTIEEGINLLIRALKE